MSAASIRSQNLTSSDRFYIRKTLTEINISSTYHVFLNINPQCPNAQRGSLALSSLRSELASSQLLSIAEENVALLRIYKDCLAS